MSVAPGPVVLSLCDRTGVMVAPWAEAGFRCLCVDVRHPDGWPELFPNAVGVGADVASFDFDSAFARASVGIVFAFPPCTHLAASGARWWAGKGLAPLIGALSLVERCREVAERFCCPWMIENPVGRLSTCWRKPDHAFDPCDFGGYLDPPGDAYTKRTCLWVGGGFVMPPPRRVEPVEGSRMHRMSSTWADERAVTPAGFARAVFEANRPAVAAAGKAA